MSLRRHSRSDPGCAPRSKRRKLRLTVALGLTSLVSSIVVGPAQAVGSGTVVGNLDIVTLASQKFQQGAARTVRIWTPATYDSKATKTRYPVVYMHDGQNLFDAKTSYAGEWQVDEGITDLISGGSRGAIVVGIDNSPARFEELSPPWLNNDGKKYPNVVSDSYADFIVKVVKPYVDARYNTVADRAHTGIGGSSMGGIMSFYMGLKYPKVFGKVLAFSPSFVLYREKDYLAALAKQDFSKKDAAPRIYFYAGGQGYGRQSEAGIAASLPAVVKTLKKAKFPSTQITSLTWSWAAHNEGAWSTAFPDAFSWLFYPRKASN